MSDAISKGVKKSWEDETIALKRRTRHWCEIRPVDSPDRPENWTRYPSTKEAYRDLGLPDNASRTRHIAFRGRLVTKGELEYEGYHWRAVLKSMPTDEVTPSASVRRASAPEPADQLIQFRCTAKEKLQITQAAGKQPVGAFVREKVIDAIRTA